MTVWRKRESIQPLQFVHSCMLSLSSASVYSRSSLRLPFIDSGWWDCFILTPLFFLSIPLTSRVPSPDFIASSFRMVSMYSLFCRCARSRSSCISSTRLWARRSWSYAVSFSFRAASTLDLHLAVSACGGGGQSTTTTPAFARLLPVAWLRGRREVCSATACLVWAGVRVGVHPPRPPCAGHLATPPPALALPGPPLCSASPPRFRASGTPVR